MPIHKAYKKELTELPKSTAIILIRRGEGTHMQKNFRGLRVGRADWAVLTPRGKRQMAKTAERIGNRTVDVMFVSTLARTRESAAELKKHVRVKKVMYDERLVEKSAGDAAGKPWTHRDLNPHQYTARSARYFREPNGESWHDLFQRTKPVLLEILKKYRGKTVVIVGHGHVNRAFFYLLTGLKLNVWVHQSVACYNEFAVLGKNITIKELNAHDE